MVKKIIKKAVEEILETGKQVVKTSGQVITGKGFSKAVRDNLYGIDQGAGKTNEKIKGEPGKISQKPIKEDSHLEKMAVQDKKKSAEAYQRIQNEIAKYRQGRTGEMGKDMIGKEEFDEEQVAAPEEYWEKQKKKAEAKKEKEVTLKTKVSRGTREIRRGIGG